MKALSNYKLAGGALLWLVCVFQLLNTDELITGELFKALSVVTGLIVIRLIFHSSYQTKNENHEND